MDGAGGASRKDVLFLMLKGGWAAGVRSSGKTRMGDTVQSSAPCLTERGSGVTVLQNSGDGLRFLELIRQDQKALPCLQHNAAPLKG